MNLLFCTFIAILTFVYIWNRKKIVKREVHLIDARPLMRNQLTILLSNHDVRWSRRRYIYLFVKMIGYKVVLWILIILTWVRIQHIFKATLHRISKLPKKTKAWRKKKHLKLQKHIFSKKIEWKNQTLYFTKYPQKLFLWINQYYQFQWINM